MSEETTPPKKYVSLSDLAAETGFSAGSMLRTVRRRNFEAIQLEMRSNAPYYLAGEDAEAFKQIIRNQKEQVLSNDTRKEVPRTGGVYFVEVPSYGGVIRSKIGWADNFEDRFNTFRTIVPDLRILAIWHTNYEWAERMAHLVARKNGKRVFTELFEFEDNKKALDELTKSFDLIGIARTAFQEINEDEEPTADSIHRDD